MSDHPDVSKIRTEYLRAGLLESDLLPSPVAQLQKWLKEAVDAKVLEPSAMTLATATPDGVPSARIVLLKGVEEAGLTFFTNYESQKGAEIGKNPNAALVFFWPELERQVRVGGKVSKVSPEESQSYFHSRPRGSQLGAWASRQSEVILNREAIERAARDVEKKFAGVDVPVPPYWGGYLLAPVFFEFWQGRASRLHDRIRFDHESNGWRISRLSP